MLLRLAIERTNEGCTVTADGLTTGDCDNSVEVERIVSLSAVVMSKTKTRA